ncbi:MurR/RpiR family transcriptional regulator [Rhizobium sp. C1]|uniref:MurR/RpiR family transcriptional regulator n=1 Tax=Rhizobium sp. C1 TaxID=1349799 RepID=UPI001E2F51C1|nr:MurR/RpiR family transcriptional regulator [Rhizobium sp. C1]MCD2177844.1 MurR/RpiR family transcriptional regulator [Rhizobium sp. C1]
MTELAQAIASAGKSLTKLEQRLANYILTRPEAVAIESSAEIAKKLNVSPMTVSRFFKKLGYESSSEAKTQIKVDLYGPGASRIGNRFDDFSTTRTTRDFRSDQQVALAGINHALKHRETTRWKEVVQTLANADGVFAVGFQTMHYLAAGLAMRLRYVRNNVVALDGSDGVYGEFFSSDAASKALIIIDTFRYGANGPRLAKAAQERGAEVIVFCDEFCEWAGEITDKVIIFPSESYYFLGMPVGINFGLNILIQDVIAALGDRAKAHIDRVSVSQDLFSNFIE